MRKPLKIVSITSLALIALVFAGSFSARQGLAYGQAATRHAAVARPRSAKPRAGAPSGSQTGIAAFQGNFTTISAPSSQVLGLARETNCSLTLLTGNYSLGSSLTYTRTGITANYDRVLHSEAGLTTTAGATYPSGCPSPTTGISSRPGVFAGPTKNGINVFAGINYSYISMSNALYILSGTDATTYGITISAFASAGALATADLNGDGNGDLVVLNSILTTSGSISVLLGNADGTFQTAVSYPTAGAGTIAAVIDDVNGDGKLDIVTVSNDQQISVLLGKGDGTFSAAQTFAAPTLPGYTSNASTPIVNLVTADLRGIGKKDVIASNGLVLLGNGDGTFTAASAPAFPFTLDNLSGGGPNLASGDLNKDGKLDLVFSTGSDVQIYLGKGDGTFSAGNSYAAIGSVGFVTVSDLDGDGNPDIYVGLANGGAYEGDNFYNNLSYALMGNGDGTFQGAPFVNGAVGDPYTGTNLGDVNGDGLPDLITLNTTQYNTFTSSFTVQLDTKTGNFTPGSTITPPASFVLGGQTTSGTGLSVGTYAVGDINGDGKADLAFLTNGADHLTYNSLIYWIAMNNGDGTFATPVPHLFPQMAPSGQNDSTDPTVVGLQIADFNHDGHADLLFTFEETNSAGNLYLRGFMVLPGNGDGTFGNPVITYTYNSATPFPKVSSPPEAVSVADLNKDGKPDLLAASLTGVFTPGNDIESQLQVYLGNGDGSFTAGATVIPGVSISVPQAPYTNFPCALADFNKDGKLDLACPGATNTGQPVLAISLGNGDGTFAAPTVTNLADGTDYTQGGIETSVTAADFDGDGNVDLAITAGSFGSGILYGKGDGTFTSVITSSELGPKDLINISNGENAVVGDFNGDGKPDILTGNTILLNAYGSITTPPLATTTTALTASASTITAGSSVTFTATITPAAGSTGTPSGTVTFLDGATTLGTGTLASGVASYSTSALVVGAHSITAVYAGDSNFSGSTSSAVAVTVNALPVSTSTALTASTASAVSGTSVTFTAIVSPASGTTTPAGTVTFADAGATIGTGSLDPTGKATFATTTLAVGSHSITAVYGGSTAFSSSTSSAVTVTITAPPPADFSLSISSASGTAPASATLTVTPVNGFNSAISFTCSGLPSGATCSFSPATLTPAGAPLTTTVSFSSSMGAMTQPDLGGRHAPAVFLAFGFGSWLLVRARRHRLVLKRLAILVFASILFGVAGCGGSGNHTVTSTVTITATGGSTSHATTYTLTTSN
jgi:Bacterial Ig-like domain (group 3)/FG-GAP-like repeat/FG-GAP repeat